MRSSVFVGHETEPSIDLSAPRWNEKAMRRATARIAEMEGRAERLAKALGKIAEREWSGEGKTWRTEAIEMQDEAREALRRELPDDE
jgi:hypothetical protein